MRVWYVAHIERGEGGKNTVKIPLKIETKTGDYFELYFFWIGVFSDNNRIPSLNTVQNTLKNTPKVRPRTEP